MTKSTPMNRNKTKLSESQIEKEARIPQKFQKIVVVMPAYNAELTLENTVRDIPEGCVDEIILTDDASSDRTVEVAKNLGLTVLCHKENRGYGTNQKTCYAAALQAGADAVIMIHPDYQYDSQLIPYALGFLETGVCDVILGSRNSNSLGSFGRWNASI